MKGVVTLLVLSVLTLAAATSSEGQQPPVRRGSVQFDRNDKVLTWRTNNSGDVDLSDRFGIKFENLMSTSLNMTTGKGVEDRWYDSVYNKADMTYRMTDRFDVLVRAQEDWSKDTLSKLGNSLFTTDFDGGLRYRPSRNMTLQGSAGHIYDMRFDNEDSGPAFKGLFKYLATPTRNFKFDVSGDAETANLKRSRDKFAGRGVITYDRGATSFSLDLRENSNNRGYFSDIDRKTIENRKRQEQTVRFRMQRGDFRNLAEAQALEFRVNLGRKLITDSANDNEKSSKYKNNAKGLEKGIGLRLGRQLNKRLTAEWAMDYGNIENGVERLSRRRTQTDIATNGSVYFGFGRADSIQVISMIKRTRIDTPAGVSNDRDELKIENGVLYTRHFSDTFETALDFRVLETHYVNIDVSQSSQNKWMKTYLFSPSLVYSPARFLRIDHSVNVYANYVTYDYDSDASPRSNISRRLTSESWADIRLSRRTLVKMGVMFEDNDYSMLNSKEQKLPSEDGLRRSGDMQVEYRFSDWLTIIPRYIYAIRRDWNVSGDNTLPIRREVDQTFGVNCRMFQTDNGSIHLNVKRIVRTTRKYPVRIRDYITLQLTYGF